MNFDSAIATHVEWKMKLHLAIASQSRPDAATIGRDDRCSLGQWLHGVARTKYGHLASYHECLGAHALFHREAGRVAQVIIGRRYAQAEELLMGPSYAAASGRVVFAINKLKGDTTLFLAPEIESKKVEA